MVARVTGGVNETSRAGAGSLATTKPGRRMPPRGCCLLHTTGPHGALRPASGHPLHELAKLLPHGLLPARLHRTLRVRRHDGGELRDDDGEGVEPVVLGEGTLSHCHGGFRVRPRLS